MCAKGFETHFGKISRDFDKHYRKDVSALRRVFEKVFHKAIRERFRLAMEACEEVAGKTVLDVGCGSGRYALELAKRGAKQVVGIDYAGPMIELAGTLAREAGLSDICKFIQADFLEYNFARKFDISLAMGVMDYTFEPGRLILKLKGITRELIALSFPVKMSIIGLQRILRFAILKSSRIQLYTEREVEELLLRQGLRKFELTRVGRNYFVAVHLREPARRNRQRTYS